MADAPQIHPLRQRMIEDMSMRGLAAARGQAKRLCRAAEASGLYRVQSASPIAPPRSSESWAPPKHSP